jgi:oligosaccharyltransferase complex subunit gamma
MHFLKGLLVSLLPFTALAAKKPTVDKFTQFHTKALSSAPLKLDDSIYNQLTGGGRDYSVAVLLTALENKFGCQLCREFQPEWDLLGKSWTKGDKKGESRLIYGTLDFSEGRGTFQSVSIPLAIRRGRKLDMCCANMCDSLACKLLLYYFFSNLLQVHMLYQTALL